MKHNSHSIALIFFFVFLITTPHSSARKMAAKQGEVDEEIDNISRKESVEKSGTIDSFDKLQGLEECQHEDEECLKRRVVLDDDVDYIYSQNNKP